MRHGKVRQLEVGGDVLSVLSPEGKEVQERMAAQLEKEGYHPKSIYCSPLLRAKQSAAIVAQQFGLSAIAEPMLEQADDLSGLLEVVKRSGPETLFVGHEPSLIYFGRQLTGENILASGLPKSGCAIITFEEAIDFGQGKLSQFLNPATLL